ncbi:LysE family translocator [Billgrantia sp. LNSP4103-1]|uniref:LysE family translocator n=1 Tax=Billgrantia sp. LNSP4103-1 TaxID=3410266 RepID=UPI00403F2733
MTPEFLLTSLLVVASPGTGVLYTLATGLAHGTRASTLAALGCTFGIVPHMLAAITGLASLLHASATAFQLLKLAGVAYLLVLAWSMLRAREGALPIAGPTPPMASRLIVTGVFVNLLNPKLTLFFFAFLPQFVEAGDAPLARMAELSLAFMLMTLAVFIVYGASAAVVRPRLQASPSALTWLRRGLAVGFLAMAVRLAMAER